mmetsp:Transcript_7851/g.14793  ORF Transcript_7851/g.14793 Transcript_7851/m.14793 type:complete len:290 (+) Transcript_7851:152-1021(+)|eukprot:CAMPEP_0176480732 /NCGR_PEP_ID=MMETSP0200_2-20121128/2435_1 /TAXON_ID=947934 /ORGANISM="Chaetoceros sp., Strain GSL56" /LENGTH=289 /DNA_ID=CAMNT_0017876873 /DNA_START=122 /DNA_END=991 /DNA_ORIENTATION=+
MRFAFWNLFALTSERNNLFSSHNSILPCSNKENLLACRPKYFAPRILKVYAAANSVFEEDNTLGGSASSTATVLPKDDAIWKNEGEKIIREAAVQCGAKSEDVNIRWLPGKIIVTLSGNTYLQAVTDDGDDLLDVEYDDDGDDDDIANNVEAMDVDVALQQNEEKDEPMSAGIDVVSVARAINLALGEQGEGSMPYNIAVHHEIEVTTPGASDELQGIMFESYKGFDVIVESIDSKVKETDRIILVEGKLVERNEEQTVINVKGRIRKLKNDLVKSVRLPKAKKEKGAK